MKTLADSSGVIAALAMDQRGNLQKALSTVRGVDVHDITSAMMNEFKVAVAHALTPHASAILLDPEFGLNAGRARAPGCGLILAYELSGYDSTRPGRLPDLLPHLSVRRLADLGADAVKILIYYSPSDEPKVNEVKHAFLERIGAECAAHEIPFVLEVVGYDPRGGDEKGIEFARQKPDIVRRSIEALSRDEFGIDLLKVEFPIGAEYVEGCASFRGQKACSRADALRIYRDAAAIASRPFVYLSGGMSHGQFLESLEFANEAHASYSGVLCGRATWKDGVGVYARHGLKGLEEWLQKEGVRNIQAVNEHIRSATPWFEKLGLAASA